MFNIYMYLIIKSKNFTRILLIEILNKCNWSIYYDTKKKG